MKTIAWQYLCFIAIVQLVNAQASLDPTKPAFDWTPNVMVGVRIEGAVPRTKIVDATKPPYNADSSGTADASEAINAALANAPQHSIIYLPAGRYRLEKPLWMLDNRTLRGDGPNTVFDVRTTNQTAIGAGIGSEWPWDYSEGTKVTAGLERNSKELILEKEDFSVGDIITISEENDTALPVVHVDGYPRLRKQRSEIVKKEGSKITIRPGLFWTLDITRKPNARAMRLRRTGMGIENLSLDMTNSGSHFAIMLEQAVGSWVKNVSINNISNFGIMVLNCFNTEVRGCDIRKRKTRGTNGAGILLERSTSCLIEDNIIVDVFPHIEVNFDSCGNVIAYNFCEINDINGVMGMSINSNHGPHNHSNLYEGNIASKFQSDGYFGGASDDTLFRNWFHGTSDTTDQFGICVFLNRFTRNYKVVGNVLGRTGFTYEYDNNLKPIPYEKRYIYALGLPNIGGGGSSGTAQLSKSLPWKDWSSLMSGLKISPLGFQELDLDVAQTTIRLGNWNAAHKAIPPSEALTAALPKSLFRQGRPDWFGSLPWPAFGPEIPGENYAPNQSYAAIPAGYRYVHGTNPPGAVSNQPTIVRIKIETSTQ